MKKQLAKQESVLEKAVSAAGRLESEITELQKKVLEAGGTRLKQAKAKAEAADNKLTDAVCVCVSVLPVCMYDLL